MLLRWLFIFIFVVSLFLHGSVWAQNTSSTAIDPLFQPNFVLDDSDILDLHGMTQEKLQNFLLSRPGMLAKYRTLDIDGIEKFASEIIWRIATSYKINPNYLLALMQKEQSLVDDPHPQQRQYDWSTGYGVCDVCSYDDPTIQNFKGFANQLEWAAKQHREKYLIQILSRGETVAGYSPGKAILIDGREIVPRNQATTMLYSYTPHIRGNYNIWRIWQKWFSLVFPEGSYVRGKTSQLVYWIRGGEKRPITSQSVLVSHSDPSKVLVVEDSRLSQYPLGKNVRFANYSLIELNSGERYLLVGSKKRHIVSKKIFAKFGFNEDEIITVQPEDVAEYEDGQDISATTTYPLGLLVKDPSERLWFLENGKRHSVDKSFLSLYFKRQTPKRITNQKLKSYPHGEPYRLHDGELVKLSNGNAVWVLEQGKRRPIISHEAFEAYGWKWKNVATLPERLLEDYPIGELITLSTSVVSNVDQ